MLRVALTGGIATGKSYVRSGIDARGIPTIDSDRLVHEMLATPGPVVSAIEARFGPSVVRPDGSVDRTWLGRLVFSNAGARSDLEAILHPLVYERIFAWASGQESAGSRWVLAEIPLLFETGRQQEFDRVIVTACAPEGQVARLMARDGAGEPAARARLAAQWPIGEKVRRGDYVIWTDGTFEDTDRQIEVVVAAIGDLARRDRAGG